MVLANQPVGWLIECMKSIGIFEAKTHLTRICDEVERSGQTVLVRRRGRPLVLISPMPKPEAAGRADIHTAWKSWKEDRRQQEFPDVSRLRTGSKSSVFEGE
jgi:antitoxin (DNA-binding transcriptional repressor) of toxin-antitoxin stability system